MQEVPAIVSRYISAYNAMDVDGMLACLDQNVRFTNLSEAEVTAETRGIEAFADLARAGAAAFRHRRQTITGSISVRERTMVKIHFEATVAADLPNGWKAGQELAFDGTSYFEHAGGKIGMIMDASGGFKVGAAPSRREVEQRRSQHAGDRPANQMGYWTMRRMAAIGLIVIGLLHLVALGKDAWPEVPALLSGALWTSDHVLLPVAARDPALVLAEHAFWSTLGSAGIPLVFVGVVTLWIGRRGLTVPPAASAILVVWSALGSVTMQPSGFPLVLLASLLLLAAGLRERGERPATTGGSAGTHHGAADGPRGG
jgi:hypothetical protein